MTQFRKRPVVIEAVQFDGWNAADVLNWCNERTSGFEANNSSTWMVSHYYGELKIRTLEGEMTATKGDWIICGVKGELYPCKPDIFAATYEEFQPMTHNPARLSTPAMSTLEALEKRLSEATGPDREIDIAIWRMATDNQDMTKAPLPWAHCYTSSIDAALTLVLDDFVWAAGDCGHDNDCAWACVTGPHSDDYPDYDASAATVPIALCLVCIRARLSTPGKE